MSNGAGETGGQHQNQNLRWRSGGTHFAMSIAKIAVAQICESQGFQGFQQSALETLSDVAMKYIFNVGKVAHDHANLANRTDCSVFDVIQGLEDLGAVQGFSGASDIDSCLGSSGMIREIVQYVSESDQIPCVYSIPKFPVAKDRILRPSFLQSGEEPPDDSIPAWLPRFPGPTSHNQSLDSNGKTSGKDLGNADKPEMVSYVNERSSFVELPAAKSKILSSESNPYLARPLPFGEKQVSSLIPPAGLSNESVRDNPLLQNSFDDNRISVVETFAPAIEAMKSKDASDDDHKVGLLNTRSNVQFKIGNKKRLWGRILELNPQEKEFKSCLWFETEDEKDDKKRRAEKILKGSLNSNQFAEL